MRQAIDVAVGILRRQDQVWVQLRLNTGHLDGTWEFPGGKFQGREDPLSALLRELHEELQIKVDPTDCRFLQAISHSYPDREIRLHFFLIEWDQDLESSTRQGRWVKISELPGLATPPANEDILRRLSRELDTAGQ